MVGEDYRSQATVNFRLYMHIKQNTTDSTDLIDSLRKQIEDREERIRQLNKTIARLEFKVEDGSAKII